MRRKALSVICLSLLIALAGCGRSPVPGETGQEEIDPAGQVEKADIPVSERTTAPGPTETAPQTEDPSDDGQPAPVREDLCAFYLEVLEDLWNVDPGLNSELTQIGIDLSGLSHLTEAEKDTVMSGFASKHDLPYIAGTLEELFEQGYIDKDKLYWEDGLFFAIKTNEDAVWDLPAITEGDPLTSFDAYKWRSGLGAYYFDQCTARKDADGNWSYTVGQQAIA